MTGRRVGGSEGTSFVMLSQTIKHKFCEIQVTGTYQPSAVSFTFMSLQGFQWIHWLAWAEMKGQESLYGLTWRYLMIFSQSKSCRNSHLPEISINSWLQQQQHGFMISWIKMPYFPLRSEEITENKRTLICRDSVKTFRSHWLLVYQWKRLEQLVMSLMSGTNCSSQMQYINSI